MAIVRRVVTLSLAAMLAILIFCGGWLIGRTGIGSVVDPSSMTEAERQFADRMQNVSLVGKFTIDGRESKSPDPDRYDIASVKKVGDELWQFNAKMDCCGVGGSGVIPIAVPMRFIGDTPTILMTDTSLPGLGTFTVRLVFYGDRYAGTWQHGKYGGHMWGRIEKQTAPIQ